MALEWGSEATITAAAVWCASNERFEIMNGSITNTSNPPGELTGRRWRHSLMIGLFTLVALTMLTGGVVLRQKIFFWSTPIHFQPDMRNAWYWGSFTVVNTKHNRLSPLRKAGDAGVTAGVFLHRLSTAYQRHDHLRGWPPTGYRLDYPAWRLAAVAISAWVERAVHPKATDWKAAYMTPLLWFNTCVELFGTIFTFLLIRHWAIRRLAQPGPSRWSLLLTRCLPQKYRPHLTTTAAAVMPVQNNSNVAAFWKPMWLGLLATALFWFNPNIIQSAHTWVQYDMWVMPFYIAALYLACTNRFFAAGAVIAVGSLLKGQELFGAGMFVLWPLLELRWMRALEFILGFFVTFSLAVALWLFADAREWLFMLGLVPAIAAGAAWVTLRQKVRWWYGPLVLLPMLPLALWPWTQGLAGHSLWVGAALALWLICAPWLVSKRGLKHYVAITLAIGFATVMLAMPAHWDWLRTGYLFGTSVGHMPIIALPNADGLGLILQDNFGWHLTDAVFTLHWPTTYVVDMRHLLFAMFVVSCIICAAAAARHARRNDPRFLLAMITPWITFFVFCPEMYERYLLWGSSMLLSAAVVLDLGTLLLAALLVLASTAMTLAVQLGVNNLNRPLSFISRTEPGLSYAIVLLALICMYLSLRSSRRGAHNKSNLPTCVSKAARVSTTANARQSQDAIPLEGAVA